MSYLGHIIAQSGAEVRARIEGFGTPYVQQSQISGVKVLVFDEATGAGIGEAFEVTAGVGISNTLLPWAGDELGYNLAVIVPATYFPKGAMYRIEATVTPVAGEPFVLIWKLEAEGTMGA